MDENSGIESIFVLGLFATCLCLMIGYAKSRRARNDAEGGSSGGDGDCGDGGGDGGGD